MIKPNYKKAIELMEYSYYRKLDVDIRAKNIQVLSEFVYADVELNWYNDSKMEILKDCEYSRKQLDEYIKFIESN